jgi:hypothetical protein
MRLIVAGFLLLFFSCGKKTENPPPRLEETGLTFRLDSLVRQSCPGENCAKLRLVWPVAKGDARAAKINKAIEGQLSSYLQLGEETSSDLNAMAASFFNSFEEFKTEVPDSFGAWEIEVKAELSYESEHTISIYFEQYNYLGGAHPNSSVDFLNFDKNTGEYLPVDRLLLDEKKVRENVEQKFRTFHHVGKEQGLEADDRFFLPETGFFLANAMGFREGRFWVIYVPYEIGPYALGYTELSFTKAEFDRMVSW